MRKITKDEEQYLTDLSLNEGDFKCELFIDGESRKNTTADIREDYGNLSAFNFDFSEKMIFHQIIEFVSEHKSDY